jgi:hypothetical protein
MKIIFQPAEPQAAIRESIILNGREIGTIFPYSSEYNTAKFQAQLKLGSVFYPGGFGMTKEEAVLDAIKTATDQAAIYTADVAALRAELEPVEMFTVPQANAAVSEMVTIPLFEYNQLLRDSEMLNALKNAGVDNWDGYGEATVDING